MHLNLRLFPALIIGVALRVALVEGVATAAPRAPLLQTGQTQCYSDSGAEIACAGTGQDGEFRAGVAPELVDNGDGTITDLVTGLMWEKMSDDGSIHDRDESFVFGTSKIDELNSTAFAGHSDWRVPNGRELESIQDHGHAHNAIRSIFQQDCVDGCTVTTCSCFHRNYHWSSTTTEKYLASHGYLVGFRFGQLDYAYKNESHAMRAVRTDGRVRPRARTLKTSQQTCWAPAGLNYEPIACDSTGQDAETRSGARRKFVDNGDGTITDVATGLMWEKMSRDDSIHSTAREFTWSESFGKITELNDTQFAGHDDWRLPNAREMASIRSFDRGKSPSRRYLAVYRVFHDRCSDGCSVTACSCDDGGGFWTSTTFTRDPLKAWLADMTYQGSMGPRDKVLPMNVRAVRTAEAP